MLLNSKPEIEVIWRPVPGTSQALALDSRADHTLYYGSRGPGKTDTQLMRFRRRVGLGYGKFWRGVIFDQEYKNLDDIVSKSKRWFPMFEDGAEFKLSTSDYKWVWPTGEELLFRSAKDERDYPSFHGQEFPFIGWNELTKYASSQLYDLMLSCNRTSFTPEKDTPKDYIRDNGKLLPPIPLDVFSTTNPKGPGHSWVKARFIDPAPVGTVIKDEHTISNPLTDKTYKVTIKQIAIKGMWYENPFLPLNYPAVIAKAANGDESTIAAWLNASWDIVSGGAFDDKFKRRIHEIPRFIVPASWPVDRVLDWGSSTPFHVGWWAQANGEEATIYHPDGTEDKFCPPVGSLILCHEWYGTNKVGSNVGLKLGATEVAKGIIEREKLLMQNGWLEEQPYGGPADNQISNVVNPGTDTIAKQMADEGVIWEKSEKSAGSNRIGLQLARDRLDGSASGEKPGIYFMRHCRASLSIIPTLPRDEKDPDCAMTTGENHPWDTMKYRILKGNSRAARQLNMKAWA